MTLMRWSVTFLAAVAILSGCVKADVTDSSSGDASALDGKDLAPGVLYVKMKAELSELTLGQYTLEPAFQIGGRFEKRQREFGLDRWYVAHFDPSVSLTKAHGDLSLIEGAEVVEGVPGIADAKVFNDPFWIRQWNLYNDGVGNFYAPYRRAGADVNATAAWEITTGSPEVIVAISDDGVDYTHEDLCQNMWINSAEAHGVPGVDDDGNGYVDDVYGANFVSDGANGMVSGMGGGDHATHIAGVIAAANNNCIGISGIAGGDGSPNSGVRIMSLVTHDDRYDRVYIYKAFQYAADNGAVIINCSWSYVDVSETPSITRDAIRYFNKYAGFDENNVQVGPMAGGLCIFSAGNESSQVCYPAMDDEVLSVAAVGADFEAAYYTNHGDWVDLAAPGGDAKKNGQIYSTLANPDKDTQLRYGYMQGTSMAAPHVTGVAALVVSRYKGKGFTRDMLFDVLVNSANPVIYQHNSNRLGSGLVDAYAALTLFENGPEMIHNLSASPASGMINLRFRQRKDSNGRYPDEFRVFVSESNLTFLNPSKPGHAVQVFDVKGDCDGEQVSAVIKGLGFQTRYYVRVAAMNVIHKMSTLSEEVSVVTSGNHPPVIMARGATSLTLENYELGYMIFEATDEDGHDLDFRLSDGLDGASLKRTGNVVNVIVNALNAEAGRTYVGCLIVSDGTVEVTADLSYTIRPDHAPVQRKALPNVLFSRLREKINIVLDDYFEDPDGDELSIIATSYAPYVVKIPFRIRNGMDMESLDYGSADIVVTATDSRGNSTKAQFVALVRDGRREIDLYPNPVSDHLFVRTATDQTADVTVHASSGAELISRKGCRITPFEPLELDMSALASGEYYVSVKGPSGAKSYPVVKL